MGSDHLKKCLFCGDPSPCEAAISPKHPRLSENLLLYVNPGNPTFRCDPMTLPFLHFFKNCPTIVDQVWRPFLKKCRKGDVIRSRRNLGLPWFKCRRWFSEIFGQFGWITASHGLGSPQKVPFLGWSEPVWSRYQPKTSQTLRTPSPICESG